MSHELEDKNNNITQEVSLRSSDDEVNNGPFKYDETERKNRLAGGARTKDILMVLCAGFALISDGYQNNVMSMLNAVFPLALNTPNKVYYTADMKTAVSNASLVGTIFGQVAIGM